MSLRSRVRQQKARKRQQLEIGKRPPPRNPVAERREQRKKLTASNPTSFKTEADQAQGTEIGQRGADSTTVSRSITPTPVVDEERRPSVPDTVQFKEESRSNLEQSRAAVERPVATQVGEKEPIQEARVENMKSQTRDTQPRDSVNIGGDNDLESRRRIGVGIRRA